MSKDLTNSPVERQNILNNPYALAEIEKATGLKGIAFEGRHVVLKEQVAVFFDVTLRTVENYLERFSEELVRNGYEVLSGKRLKDFKLVIQAQDVPEIDFGNMAKTPQLSVLDFKAFLNLAMVLAESERARVLRQAILDIVIDTINARTGGGTKYINQRDEEFLQSAFVEENYRKQFTDALDHCVDMGKVKYAIYTDKIYVSIFKEKSQEYRCILRMSNREVVRDTFYSEVLDLIASFECGLAAELQRVCTEKGRKLTPFEVDQLFKKFEAQPALRPLVEKARNKMASRDLAFRDALHLRLKDYITPVQREDYERFLGEKSKELAQRLEEAKDVMKRLKDRE
ncbi:MAG: hypothetical protein K1X42_13430 [Opitutaceae bacterium]|nr:hypothetical protein [Opitutaceae bacterium]